MSYKLIPNEIESYPSEDLILHFTSQKWLNVAVSRETDLRWGGWESVLFFCHCSILIKTKGEEKNT